MKFLFSFCVLLTMFLSCDTSNDPVPAAPPCNCTGSYLRLGDSAAYLSFPTAFTPNGDGYNDAFRVLRTADSGILPGSYQLTVTSGNDTIVFQTADAMMSWFGKDTGGAAVVPGIYYYSVKFSTPSGKAVDTCGCITILKDSSGCVIRPGSGYYFEDQFNPQTGQPEYQTSEHFCD